MEKMYEIAESEKIHVIFKDYDPPLHGIYIGRENHSPIIGLSTHIKRNTPFLRSVMAEELGHHFTCAGVHIYKAYSKNFRYCDKLNVDRCEYKAMKWAAMYLMPDNDLIDAFQDGAEHPAALAEYFVVMPYVVDFRLRLWQQSSKCFELREKWREYF